MPGIPLIPTRTMLSTDTLGAAGQNSSRPVERQTDLRGARRAVPTTQLPTEEERRLLHALDPAGMVIGKGR